ncbi:MULTISPECIES: NAD(P)/FAD-dependent oxidoreductase [Streptomyces]|uniref:NAD(P)/FAD-dependent oxidoreductase n=2 Tax=Streptomyces TaxID=1883 RepID=A0A3R7ESN7_9ACTN|nr:MULTISPECIES: NAD(P)/FAD-dependent oxidoreductase [Streptomyces]KNE84327.1 thioredoxin reductase [Streptomyces fradiae]OFA58884.1 thioredoxin reductase [Streptomyces fradiae]PQM22188.1 NAD(P)/FAD-dependent oxidoreductase [Streptomyces xinghaiensis]RKM95440.1 NAD(P)/FAD-dependent oxidoreductase [Streptomyces xinghaiensis]RNC73024.1 NAD(P)/FAD-dependent oxidoreductase [Streptomyces xinghaiensis]
MPGTTVAHATDELPDETVDAVVIGGGAAGLNGALMLARSRRSVVVIDSGTPRNAPAEGVHGLLGLDGTPPAELLRRGREEVRRYGGLVVTGDVVSARPAAPSAGGDPRFAVTLAGGGTLRTRRLLVATGLRDVLPGIPGLARHWGRGVVHCPYCHGWEVRDEPIGILAVGPASVHHALLFRQLTDDLVYFTRGTELDEGTRARLAARGVRVVDTPVTEVVTGGDGGITGVRLSDGQVVPRRVLAVVTTLLARTEGLEELALPTRDLPGGMGRHIAGGTAGATEVPGVWVAGNATEPMAQVGASAAAGALAGAHMNADLAAADTEAALAAARRVTHA